MARDRQDTDAALYYAFLSGTTEWSKNAHIDKSFFEIIDVA